MKKSLALLLALLSLTALGGCKKKPYAPPGEYTYEYTRADGETRAEDETTTAPAETTLPAETTTAPAGTTAPAETATAPAGTTAPAVTTTAPAGTTAPAVTTTRPAETTRQAETAPQTTAAPPPTTKPPETTAPAPKNQCTVEIRCDTVLRNMDKLKKNKAGFLPADGVILPPTKTAVGDGDTAFDVLRRVCAENTCPDGCIYCRAGGIQLEYTYSPGFNTTYIEGIHQLYEKDCGSMSGWMYSVNGVFPNEGASSFAVSPGDVIVFAYTCDMGDDIGNSYEGN